MFAVKGVSRAKCEVKAKKKVDLLRGDEKPTNGTEYAEALTKQTDIIFEKAKPEIVSKDFSMPSCAYEFIELAKGNENYRNLSVVKKVPKLNKDGSIALTKGKKPQFEWLPIGAKCELPEVEQLF